MRYIGRILLTLLASFGCAAASIPAWAQAPGGGALTSVAPDTAGSARRGMIATRVLTRQTGLRALLGRPGREPAAQAVLLAETSGSMATGAAGATSGEGSQSARPPEKRSSEGEELESGGTFKIINFVILAAGLGFLLRKPLGSFLAERADTIREGLEEGRKALEASQSRLKQIEEKLGRLEEEIASFKAAAAAETEAEHQRLQRSAAEEADKIIQSARAQIEISARAAKLELKAYTAEQAVRLAEELVRRHLDDTGRHRLVTQFVEGLRNGRSPGS